MSSCLVLQKCQHNLKDIYLEFCTSMLVSLSLPAHLKTTRLWQTMYGPSHTLIATYSCWILVSSMSSPAVSDGTVSSERYCTTWVRTLQHGRGWKRAMRPNTSISPKYLSNAFEIRLTSRCQQLSVWVWGQIGCSSQSQDSCILFQEIPCPITRLLSSTTLLEGTWTESCSLLNQQLNKAGGRLPAARYHYPQVCIHRIIE